MIAAQATRRPLLRGLIFDLDGTLGDTLPLCIEAFRRTIEPLSGRSLTDREIMDTFGPSEEGTIRQLIPDHYTAGVRDYLRYYAELHDLCPAPFPGITELLDVLRQRNLRLGMVTGKGEHSTRITLRRFGLTGYFDPVETGRPEGPGKPQGLRRVLAAWPDIAPQELLYLGDAPSDIRACQETGVPVAAVLWANTTEAAELLPLAPTYAFRTVAELRAWLLAE